MEWLIAAAVGFVVLFVWRSQSKKGNRDVASVLATALRNNVIYAISNDYDAKRIAKTWVQQAPPRFGHESIGGVKVHSTAIGEAFFILASRIRLNAPPHIKYEKASVAFLLLLTERGEVNQSMTSLDDECRGDAARAVADAGGFGD